MFAEETRSIYDIHLFANLSKHSLDFSVSSQQDDERRRDYRVEDSMYGASAQAHTSARIRTKDSIPEQLPTDTEITA